MVPYKSVGVKGDDPFRNPVRRELFEVIRNSHKITQKGLQQACGIRSRSSVTHHLRVLERLGYVTHGMTEGVNVYEPTIDNVPENTTPNYSEILAGRPINHRYNKHAPDDISAY
ncbi:MAG: hypothetical protein HY366_00045 [Candidatus Aenigmarchaeota archaeon]|nr:hypothetical protein [Candidatus Aenigmarchaeota archaeon]